MRVTGRLSSALAVTAVMSLVAACGSGDDGSSDTAAVNDTEATEVTTTAAPDTSVAPDGTDDAASSDTTMAAAGGGVADESLDPVRFGYVNQEIGTPAFPEGSAAVEATVEYINAELGGIDGRPLEVVVCQVDVILAMTASSASSLETVRPGKPYVDA